MGFFNELITTGNKISFKLETNEKILNEQITKSLKNYNSDLIFGNMLHTRYKEIFLGMLVEQKKDPLDLKANKTMVMISKVSKKSETVDIESNMVDIVIKLMDK